jgi:hypothetical protein
LLLVDKLSQTSNETNLSLINEFTYYVRQQIKKDKQEEIQKIAEKTLNQYPEYNKNFLDENKNIDIDKII